MSSNFSDLEILEFVFLALKETGINDRQALIKTACQYGRAFDVEPEEIERILDKKIIEFL